MSEAGQTSGTNAPASVDSRNDGVQESHGARASQRVDERRDTMRLEAFSDGVFAIAITLLVLTFKVPGATDPHDPRYVPLLDALRSQWPAYLAYVTSFFAILVGQVAIE